MKMNIFGLSLEVLVPVRRIFMIRRHAACHSHRPSADEVPRRCIRAEPVCRYDKHPDEELTRSAVFPSEVCGKLGAFLPPHAGLHSAAAAAYPICMERVLAPVASRLSGAWWPRSALRLSMRGVCYYDLCSVFKTRVAALLLAPTGACSALVVAERALSSGTPPSRTRGIVPIAATALTSVVLTFFPRRLFLAVLLARPS